MAQFIAILSGLLFIKYSLACTAVCEEQRIELQSDGTFKIIVERDPCPPSQNCQYGERTPDCECCPICAKGPGSPCGPEGDWFSGSCGDELTCIGTAKTQSESFGENGVCVSDEVLTLLTKYKNGKDKCSRWALDVECKPQTRCVLADYFGYGLDGRCVPKELASAVESYF